MIKVQTTTVPTTSQSPAEVLWRIAASELEQASARFEQNWSAYEAAEAAAKAERPERLDELEQTFGLRPRLSPSEAIEAVDRIIEARECAKVGDRDFTDDEADEQANEAERIVGEYFGLLCSYERIWDRHRVNELHREHQAFVSEVYNPAREKLLATPAPDFSALLFKASVLAMMWDDAEGLEKDLQRLLTGIE
jgi:hypothetical protein